MFAKITSSPEDSVNLGPLKHTKQYAIRNENVLHDTTLWKNDTGSHAIFNQISFGFVFITAKVKLNETVGSKLHDFGTIICNSIRKDFF